MPTSFSSPVSQWTAFRKRFALPAFWSEPLATKRELPTTTSRGDFSAAFFSSGFFSSARPTAIAIVTGPGTSFASFWTASSWSSPVSPHPSDVVSTSIVVEVAGGVFASWTSAFATERASGKSTGIPCSDSDRTIGWLP